MNKISRVGLGGVSSSTGVRPSVSRGGNSVGGVSIREGFDFSEVDLPKRELSNQVPEMRAYRNELIELFLEVLQAGADIVPTRPRDHGEYIVEASFTLSKSKNARPRIQAPLRGVTDKLIAPLNGSIIAATDIVAKYVDLIVDASTDADLVRLLVVISHEFGHYISFLRGFHDKELQIGLHLLSTKQANFENADFTWLVFREESTAWYHAKQVLDRIKFSDWAIFEKVKNNSLSTYLSALQLEKASLQIYYKLSLLGDDFLNNCKSEFFQKLA